MASLMNTDCGLAPFMDNYIVILAGRYAAPIDCGSFPKAHAAAWTCVARALQAALQHPQTDEERQQLTYVDPQYFTAEVCHHRASYLLWKARRREVAQQQAAQPSKFNVTQHSIGNEIALIYQNAKASLPTISTEVDDDDDDESSVVEPLAIFPQKTVEEVARDQRLAEAEDELMRKVQELQVDFFGKHRKWVEVPWAGDGATPINSPQKSAHSKSGAAAESPARLTLREENFCIDNINRKMLVEVTAEEIGVVFDALDISEHKSAFRRTNGRVLKTLQRNELNERFGRDREAADLLWAWLDERRGSAVNSKSSTPTKGSIRPGTAEDAARQQVTAMLDMFRRMGNAGPTKPAPSPQYLDPLAQMKRAMNPHRPLRPSQQDYDEEEAMAALADDGEDPTAKPLPNHGRGGMDPRRGPAVAPAATAAFNQSASARANRWNVVEYEDDDD